MHSTITADGSTTGRRNRGKLRMGIRAMADDDGTSGTTKTLTQADIDRAFAAGASREREKLTAKYADYDELKAKAAEADKSKSQLDRIEQKLAETTERAAKAERDALVREVADEL